MVHYRSTDKASTELLTLMFRRVAGSLNDWRRKNEVAYTRILANIEHDGICFIAEADDKAPDPVRIVAYVLVGYDQDSWAVEIMDLYVLDSYRRQGIATNLMRRAHDWARALPQVRHIEVQVSPANERAIALYEKMGFATRTLWMEAGTAAGDESGVRDLAA